MIIKERMIKIRKSSDASSLLTHFSNEINKNLNADEIPLRFVVCGETPKEYLCEVGILEVTEDSNLQIPSIFSFHRRIYENPEQFNISLIIPTGIGCELGGHSGDGGAVARLFASICDNLITHPNVVNAADINEIPDNALYVEGSVLTRLFMGTATLQKVRANRVLLVIDKHEDPIFHELAINVASAARATTGMDIPLVAIMEKPFLVQALFSTSGRASGRVENFQQLREVLNKYKDEYDAVALSTLIAVPDHFHINYFKDQAFTVNPWGGVEAMLTHSISSLCNVQSAHSPMMTSQEIMNLNVGIVDPRKAAEATSTTYLYCVLKGLHRAPKIIDGLHSGNGLIGLNEISCLVLPDGCIGLPVLAALENDIPVIAVKDRTSKMKNDLRRLPFKTGKLHFAENYLEAVGIASSIRAGLAVDTLTRPIKMTRIEVEEQDSGNRGFDSLRGVGHASKG